MSQKSRLNKIEHYFQIKEFPKNLDMRVEFISCDLDNECPVLRDYGMYAPDNLLVVDGKCQHRLKDEPVRGRKYITNPMNIRNMEGNRVDIV
jgi:hypothetical protein